MTRRYDTIVIGGGQAGLALGWHLARRGADFLILDSAPRVGGAWRSRWASLRLFTPARHCSLPGLAFAAEDDHLPGKDEVADYLESYARSFGLPVRSDEPVHTVRPCLAGGFIVATSQHTYEADHVVIATGPFQRPTLPQMARGLAVPNLHSSEYRDPAQLPGGPVLVVGGGNSGVQIAEELAATRPTWLAVGSRLPRLPARFLGRSIFWWLERTGALDVSVESRLGRYLQHRDTLIGSSPYTAARRLGVRVAGRAVHAEGSTVRTQDGRVIEVNSVVWATGFRSDYGFLHAPVIDADGRPVHRRGVTRVPGLYFLGLPWQYTRGSALIGWVARDAAFIADRIALRPTLVSARANQAVRTNSGPCMG
jgi:putative flavoprotein involved in K+ transport